jgi:hypothetical protein
MGILSKHIGSAEPVDIDGDKIMLYPLTIEDLPDFFKAMKAFSGAKEGASAEEALKNISDEGLGAVRRIIEKTLAKSLPQEPEDDRKVFALKYMMVLFPKIMEINMASSSHESVKKQAIIEALKK